MRFIVFFIAVAGQLALSGTPHIKNSNKSDADDTFPCKIDQNAQNPPIKIVGEIHGARSSEKLRDELSNDPKILFAQEGLPYSENKKGEPQQPYGIESKEISSFVFQVIGASGLESIAESKSKKLPFITQASIAGFATSIKNSALFKKAWNKVVARLQNEDDKKTIASINSIMEGKQNTQTKPSATEFLKIYRAFLFEAGELMESLPGTPPLSFSQDLKKAEEVGSLDKATVRKITIDLRNLVFLKNIKKNYCEALKNNKALVVVVGRDHLEGLKNMLEQNIQNKIPLEFQKVGGPRWVSQLKTWWRKKQQF